MALSAAAQLLDELMGRNRNAHASENQNEIRWDDETVCKYYICGFCPHDLFVNTRADLGTCDKLHDDALRKEYQQSSSFEKMGYEEDFFRYLQQLVQDVEKRIRRGHQRLALSNNNLSFNPAQAKEDKLSMLTEKINELVEQAEELGCEGKVEEAQGVMKLCEQLREERKQIETSMQANTSTEPEKMMEVCTVCGALLVVGDVQQRVDEHIMGKQHAGYARIRSFVEGVKEKKEKDLEKEARLLKEREEREIERAKEREARKQREREKELEKEKLREREREKDRERRRDKHRKRSRSRDRRRSSSRERKRSRSRSRHRHHRSRSRDRHRRHRSRSHSHSKKSDRKRSRSREKKSSRKRSRSREKRRRSRSRDRRSRSKDSRRRSRSRERSKEKKHDRHESVETDDPGNSKDEVTTGVSSGADANGEDSRDAGETVENPMETNTDFQSQD